MIVYFLIFVIFAFFFFSSYFTNPKSVVFLACSMLGLCLFIGLADMMGGYDRYIYGELFDRVADITDKGGNYSVFRVVQPFAKEPGFFFLNILCSFFTSNRYIFIFMLTALIYGCLYVSFKRYMANYPLSMILFFGLMLTFSFTYLRQFIAFSIAWLGFEWIVKRKWYFYIPLILLVATIHNSALVLLPLYFIPLRKHSKETIIGGAVLCMIVGASPLLMNVLSASEALSKNTQYLESVTSFNPQYIALSLFFLVVILLNYDRFPNDKRSLLMLNAGLLFCAILLLFVRNSNGGRISWYYWIGIISTMTIIVQRQRAVSSLSYALLCMCFFFNYRLLSGSDVKLKIFAPYKSFLTNGVRENDPLPLEYEYDHNYDHNKFYRKAFKVPFLKSQN